MFDSVAIPFVVVGNRRGLTGAQIAGDPCLKDFYSRFQHCFEPALNADIALLIEDEMQTSRPEGEAR